MTLAGKTLFISGGSRGIGLAIALRAARDGANVALIAKTAEPHPKLEGTVYTAAAQIEGAGGRALPVVGDIRDEDQVAAAVAQAVERFGGIDVCVNNASPRFCGAAHDAWPAGQSFCAARPYIGVCRRREPQPTGCRTKHCSPAWARATPTWRWRSCGAFSGSCSASR